MVLPVLPEALSRRYILEELLGAGATAKVYKAIDKPTGGECAIKVVNRDMLDRESEELLRREVSIMQMLDHPSIIRVYDFHELPDRFFIVLELCDGGELFDRIVKKEKYTEREVRDMSMVMVKAISYMHHHKVVHRDLKPENLLLGDAHDDTSIKIADFGLSAHLPSEGAKLIKRLGTPAYVAPEVVQGQPYDTAVDMWAVGVIVYILLCGAHPFYDTIESRMLQRISRGDHAGMTTPLWDKISPEAKDFVSRLMVVDPDHRMTAKEALRHQWLHVGDLYLARRDLHESSSNLRAFNARRKLKAAVKGVMAAKRLGMALDRMMIASLAKPTTPTPPATTMGSQDGNTTTTTTKELMTTKGGGSGSSSSVGFAGWGEGMWRWLCRFGACSSGSGSKGKAVEKEALLPAASAVEVFRALGSC